jgi:UDP-N-acetylglucosamine--N-acetylmuramyl-(pentapeptide) pyrophosphoryl-undecaprenol N-acetylglucosamine transferase
MGIPTIVHESNAIPGRAVRKLARKIDLVMVNFEASAKDIQNAKKVICVGNPALIGQKKEDKSANIAENFEKSVLSFGGSLGAETLNLAIADMLCALADKYPETEFYHAAGKRDFENLKSIFESRGLLKKKNIKLVDYIYDMDDRMKRADLVISRAGAMTLSELSLMGKAAILVPSPYVAANHQFKNANAIYTEGGCMLVEEKDFSSGKLTESVDVLLSDEAKRSEIGEKIKKFAKNEANKTIYEEIKKVIAEK